MKRTKFEIALVYYIMGICIVISYGCNKQSSTPTSPSCSSTGTAVNIGTSTGGNYGTDVGSVAGHGDAILFNNTNLNFSGTSSNPDGSTAGGMRVLDVGQQSCLDFSYSGTPTAISVAYKPGEGYVGLFDDGHIVKFIAISYNGAGVVLINYIFQ